MNIPLVDLYAQYLTIKEDIDTAIESVIRESSFIRGKHVKSFEENFAKLMGIKHCISCGNGTDSLYIIMKMMGIGPGDEVITTAHSWIASSETISQTGAKVIFVDTKEDSFTIDTDLIEQKITPRTKAILPVHLYGHPVNMDEIMQLADQYDLLVIEDCAQAHLAEYKHRLVGTIGHAGSFSFYPGKNLGAYGDAGAIITNDDELAKKCRMYAHHGALEKHSHDMEGINSRLDGMQAAILNVKLPYLEAWTSKRINVAKQYNQLLKGLSDVKLPKVEENVKHVFHLYVIKVNNRDKLKNWLDSQGIGTTIQYPTALPLLPAYQYLEHTNKDFPVAYSHQNSVLSLPMFPEISEDKVKYVAEKIKEFYQH